MNKKKIKDNIIHLDVHIASVSMAILVGVTFLGVIMRYVVGKPFGWIEEIQAFLIVWVVFLGAGSAYRTGNHARIEFLYDKCNPTLKKILDLVISVIATIVIGFFLYASIKYIGLFIKTGRKTSVLQISYVAIYSVVPISCILQFLNFYVVEVFHKWDEKESLIEESLEEKENA